MSSLFDLFIKRVNDQAATYAAAQSDIARRTWGDWFDPFHILQPAKVAVPHRAHPTMPRRGPDDRRRSY